MKRDPVFGQPLCECKRPRPTTPAWDKERGWVGARCTLCGKLVRIRKAP